MVEYIWRKETCRDARPGTSAGLSAEIRGVRNIGEGGVYYSALRGTFPSVYPGTATLKIKQLNLDINIA